MATLPLAALSADELIKWALIFFLFILPAIKGLLSNAQKNAGQAKRAPVDDEPEGELPGEEVWKRLLRGEPIDQPPAAPAPPAAPTRRVREPASRPAPAVSYAENVLEASPEPPAALDVLASAQRAGKARPRSADHESVTHIESFRSSMEPAGESGSEMGGSFVSLSERTSVARSRSARRSAMRHFDWRQAIVLREVLGTPVALRGGEADLPSLR